MGAGLLAAIERLRKTPWVVLFLLFVSIVGALAQFTGAASSLLGLVRPHADPRGELAKLGVAFDQAAMAKAAANGDARVVGLLIDAGMAVDAGPDPAVPPLMLAAQSGSVLTVKRLLDAGANPAWSGAAGNALGYAIYYNHPPVVTALLAKPLPQQVIAEALVTAARVGDLGSIDRLAPLLTDKRTAALAALQALVASSSSSQHAAPAIAALAAFQPDLNAPNPYGQSLLHVAVANDELPVLTALLKAGADPNVRGRCHTPPEEPLVTPLSCAVTRGTSDGLASTTALIAAHADLEARGAGGATPLILAAANDDTRVTTALLEAGADPRARDASGKTALDRARTADYNDPGATIAVLSEWAAKPRP